MKNHKINSSEENLYGAHDSGCRHQLTPKILKSADTLQTAIENTRIALMCSSNDSLAIRQNEDSVITIGQRDHCSVNPIHNIVIHVLGFFVDLQQLLGSRCRPETINTCNTFNIQTFVRVPVRALSS